MILHAMPDRVKYFAHFCDMIKTINIFAKIRWLFHANDIRKII